MFAEACVACVSIMNQSGESCQKRLTLFFFGITQAANLMSIIISYQTLTTLFTSPVDIKNFIIPDSHSSFSSKELFNMILNSEEMPKELKKKCTGADFKKKGDLQSYNI